MYKLAYRASKREFSADTANNFGPDYPSVLENPGRTLKPFIIYYLLDNDLFSPMVQPE